MDSTLSLFNSFGGYKSDKYRSGSVAGSCERGDDKVLWSIAGSIADPGSENPRTWKYFNHDTALTIIQPNPFP